MRVDIVTLFPDMLNMVRDYGIPRRALEAGLLQLAAWNPRDYSSDNYRTVDDRPYGGGPGMVMMVEPLRRAIEAARAAGPAGRPVIYLSPQGQPLGQRRLADLAASDGFILLAGRYEGIDERLIELEVDEELSIGDYVLSGGELPAMVVLDGVVRLLPGALGNADSSDQDSFSADGLLDCPHYTRPENIDGLGVPAVLQSGNHREIARWRQKMSLGRTWEKRPDLLSGRELTPEEQKLLLEYQKEHAK